MADVEDDDEAPSVSALVVVRHEIDATGAREAAQRMTAGGVYVPLTIGEGRALFLRVPRQGNRSGKVRSQDRVDLIGDAAKGLEG